MYVIILHLPICASLKNRRSHEKVSSEKDKNVSSDTLDGKTDFLQDPAAPPGTAGYTESDQTAGRYPGSAESGRLRGRRRGHPHRCFFPTDSPTGEYCIPVLPGRAPRNRNSLQNTRTCGQKAAVFRNREPHPPRCISSHPERYSAMIEKCRQLFVSGKTPQLAERNRRIKETMSAGKYREMMRERIKRWHAEHPDALRSDPVLSCGTHPQSA